MDKIATKEQLGTTAERLKGLVSDLATATTEALEEVAGGGISMEYDTDTETLAFTSGAQ